MLQQNLIQMLSKEDFIKYYETHGKCINDISMRKGKLNEKQLSSRYEKYVSSQLKKSKIEIDEKWDELKKQLPKECALIKRLKELGRYDLLTELKKNGDFLLDTIDGAHYKSRSRYPEMKYLLDNVVPLNRYSHSMIDQYRNPIDGESISKEEHEQWWELILGTERFERLNKISANKT